MTTTTTTETVATYFTDIIDNRVTPSIAEILRRARSLGYPLVQFDGWSDSDLGMPGNRGPRYDEALANGQRLRAICATFQDVSILQTTPTESRVLDDDAALAIARASLGDVSGDR